ncbi:MAG: response regulator transcription factor [Candidatus Omnitrophica bacterium]|nr:response regulator transcription factor [Candidatus Omnitrophota bacterium]
MNNHGQIIYIVDDDASVCKALKLLLEQHGFKVETFPCAADFLSFKHPKVPSCLVSDIRMPGISGLALQETMALQQVNVPIVFITGHGNIPMSVKAVQAGAIDFLPKPFTEKKLLNAIERAIAKNKIQNKQQAEINKIKQHIKTLSPRELEVFRLVALGMLNKQIASKRGNALQTIKVHRGRVMQKMQAKTVTELIHFAQKAGITSSLD